MNKKIKTTLSVLGFVALSSATTTTSALYYNATINNKKLSQEIDDLKNKRSDGINHPFNGEDEISNIIQNIENTPTVGNLTPYKLDLDTQSNPFYYKTLQNNYIKDYYQYDLPTIKELPLNDKIRYIRKHAGTQNSTYVNSKATLINTWSNVFNIDTYEKKYLFSTKIDQTYDSIQLGLGMFGSGSIITIHKYFQPTVTYRIYILTNHHVAKLIDQSEQTLYINHNNDFISYYGLFKEIPSLSLQNEDLAIMSFDIKEEQYNAHNKLFEPFLNNVSLINGVNVDVKDITNQLLSTKLLVKKRDKYNNPYYSSNVETVIANPFNVYDGGQNNIFATLDKSLPGVSGSKISLLYKDKEGKIVPVIYGVVSGGWLNEKDVNSITNNLPRNNLDFSFSVDNNYVGLSFIKHNLSLLKPVIDNINREYLSYLKKLEQKGENHVAK